MNKFKDYWANLRPMQKKALAEKAGTSYNHLSQVANGHSLVGMDLGCRLADADKKIRLSWFVRQDVKKTG